MSAIKRAVAQKIALQQAELIAVSPSDVDTIPAVQQVLAAAQAAEEKAELSQDIIATAQEDLPVDLAQLAEEFHAESIAYANDNAGGEILLAQAAQGKKDDGGVSLMNADGSLGTGGIAALVGLGVLAAAGGGGGGGGGGVTPVNLVATNTGVSPVGGLNQVSVDIPGTYLYDNGLGSNNKFTVEFGNYDGQTLADDIRIRWKDGSGGPNAFVLSDVTNSLTLVVETYSYSVVYDSVNNVITAITPITPA